MSITVVSVVKQKPHFLPLLEIQLHSTKVAALSHGRAAAALCMTLCVTTPQCEAPQQGYQAVEKQAQQQQAANALQPGVLTFFMAKAPKAQRTIHHVMRMAETCPRKP